MKAHLSEREMRRAFYAADPSYDGVFLTGVRSTKIFCRPSCPARRPKPENIEFFTSTDAALTSGFRPCKRCQPLEAVGAPPRWVQKLMQRLEARPAERIRTAEMRAIGIDPARARRYFMKRHGMTFQAFCRQRRLALALRGIQRGATVSEVAIESGFESESGFRSAFAKAFGGAPTSAPIERTVMLDWIESPVGPLIAGATDEAICLLEFSDRNILDGQLTALKRRLRAGIAPGANPLLKSLREQLGEYFAGRRRAFDLPLSYPGTPFQQKVWSKLLEIPYGETWSYRQLATAVGDANASRAVGTANGLNRICIVIPCHRVVNASGELGGYGGGLWRKRILLDLELGQRKLI